MIIEFSEKCQKELVKTKQKNIALFKRVEKQLVIFQTDQFHPSLRLHKLSGDKKEVWSISVDMSVRMLFYFRQSGKEKRAVFFAIGKHDEAHTHFTDIICS